MYRLLVQLRCFRRRNKHFHTKFFIHLFLKQANRLFNLLICKILHGIHSAIKSYKTKKHFACFIRIENYFREQLGQINLKLCIGL